MLLIPKSFALIAKLTRTDALHMRTAYFLLDWLMAFWAFSCIVFDPGHICLLRVYYFSPFLDLEASGRGMGLLLTSEAVHFSTGAVNHSYLHQTRLRTEVWAFLVGAIADIFVLDSVAHADFFTIKLL